MAYVERKKWVFFFPLHFQYLPSCRSPKPSILIVVVRHLLSPYCFPLSFPPNASVVSLLSHSRAFSFLGSTIVVRFPSPFAPPLASPYYCYVLFLSHLCLHLLLLRSVCTSTRIFALLPITSQVVVGGCSQVVVGPTRSCAFLVGSLLVLVSTLHSE